MRYLRRPYDQDWLDYQHEIGLRHTHLKKNKTDEAQTPSQIPLRYIIAFTAVINDTIKPFLASKGNSVAEVEAMHRAWCKAALHKNSAVSLRSRLKRKAWGISPRSKQQVNQSPRMRAKELSTKTLTSSAKQPPPISWARNLVMFKS